MPDITMCANADCPFREKCYRYRAIPDDYYQSWAIFQPDNVSIIDGIAIYCKYFWQIDWVKDIILPTEVIDKKYKKEQQ